jgi:hypothetical protein
MNLTEQQIQFFKKERQKHLDELNAISGRAEAVARQYKEQMDEEINAVETINKVLEDAGVVEEEPVEEEQEEIVE